MILPSLTANIKQDEVNATFPSISLHFLSFFHIFAIILTFYD